SSITAVGSTRARSRARPGSASSACGSECVISEARSRSTHNRRAEPISMSVSLSAKPRNRYESDTRVKRPRILLADDHRLLREALVKLLEPACDVVGAVMDGRALLEAAPKLRPDVVVVDIAMPLLNGLDAARQLKRLMPAVKVIFLTVSEDPELAAEAFRAGGSAFLLKNSAASELLQAITDVIQGRSYVTPLATRDMVDNLLRQPEAGK